MLALVFYSSLGHTTICNEWKTNELIGYLDLNHINEASGISASVQFPKRLYHVNDSGSGPFFYQTNLFGRDLKKIRINGFNPKDVEDLAYGKCGDDYCLVIGDIGDNAKARSIVTFVLIKEEEDLGTVVDARHIVHAKYPDGPHNVEGMAMHPNGDLYLITKEMNYSLSSASRAGPAKVYRLKSSQLLSEAQGSKRLSYVGSLDLPYHLGSYSNRGQIVTSFDISRDGKNILLLTYKAAIEIEIDLNAKVFPDFRRMKKGKNFQIIDLSILPQQEAITYLATEDAFIYNTELKWRRRPIEILKNSCMVPRSFVTTVR